MIVETMAITPTDEEYHSVIENYHFALFLFPTLSCSKKNKFAWNAILNLK